MAFDTGLFNKQILVGQQDADTGRMVKEDNGIVNRADWLEEVTTPGSGREINTTEVIPTVLPIHNFRATTALGRKVHFEQNFDSGFDTLNDCTCVFDGAVSTESRNTSESNPAGELVANLEESSLSMKAASDGSPQSVIIIESKNYLKMPQSGRTYLEEQGIYEHIGNALGNPTTFVLFQAGESPVPKTSWNVDTFDGTGPSGIELDFTKVQTAIFEYSGKNKGDAKFGFLVNDTLYFAHLFSINNVVDSTKTLNLPIRTEILVTGATTERYFGLYNNEVGYYFGSVMATITTPEVEVHQTINSIVCYTVGADPVEKKVPFVAGNKDTFKNVTAADTHLFSLQCADVFSSAVNRSVYNIGSLEVISSSQNENFGCYIKILYNASLAGDTTFIALPGNDQSALKYNLNATASGGVEIFSTYIMANEKSTFSMADLFKNYRKEFSRNEIVGFGVGTYILNQTLTVVASPMQGAISTTSLDVSANIFGGEVG